MQNTIFFFLFLCFTNILVAQDSRPKKNTSLGIDFLVIIATLSDFTTVDASTIDIVFKEHLEKSAIRFRASVTSFNSERQQFKGFKPDSTFVRSYYKPYKQYGIALGGEVDLTKSKNPMYAGLDVGLNFKSGSVGIERCLNQDCETIQSLETKSKSLELTPFIGWEINLNERFFLNLELGPYLLFTYGEHPFADADEDIQTLSINETEINMGRVLRDISINYRF